ncbi:type III secretion low calcium response chaperone LcrH/SycD [Tepidimonas alkaliphilus]|uniref:Type III secretion low calcium response chaperone LcrH/SycD n=1 Tax=Tepidimonas alkaliphilus TaxID=2588942 RepID=A0A554W9F7_9BURK|nr:tetratricopeptide repeat protein [Tepidimonas alkaliphilus]TSE20205.1 type III secretion low calcium response chaperone LcrH/SycD [Tepidimonas alkaliphilus]
MTEMHLRRAGILTFAVSALAIWLVYWPGLRNEFVFDDFRFIDGSLPLDRPYSFWLGFRSLWSVSFPFIHQVIGPDVAWQRAFNILLHLANAWLLWLLVRWLFDQALRQENAEPPNVKKSGALPIDGAGQAAVALAILLWAVNPVAVYSVIYLIQRSSLMAMFFMLAMFVFFIQALRSKNWYWGLASGLSYGLVLLSKEHAAPSIALLLPIYVFWSRPSFRSLAIFGGGLGLLALLAAVWLIQLKGWKLGAATEDMVKYYLEDIKKVNVNVEGKLYILSLINQLRLFLYYGFLWFVPWTGWLSIDVRTSFPVELFSWHLVGAAMAVVLIAASIYVLIAKRGRVALAGLAILMPAVLFTTELAYVRIQEVFVLYRSYLWSVSWPILVALALTVLKREKAIYILGLGLVILFAWMARDRVASFRDNVTVWKDAVEKIDLEAGPEVLGRWRAPLNLSMGLLQKKDYQEALRYAELADKLKSPEGLGKFNQATALANLGNIDQALTLYEMAEAEGFPRPEILNRDRAIILMAVGRFDEALSSLDKALAITQNKEFRADLLIRAGRAANNSGQYDRAIQYYESLRLVKPDLTAAPIGIAYSYYKKGDVDSALKTLNQSLAKKPTADVLHARSFLFYQMGNRDRALNDINVALVIEPGNPVYQAFKQKVLAGQKVE